MGKRLLKVSGGRYLIIPGSKWASWQYKWEREKGRAQGENPLSVDESAAVAHLIAAYCSLSLEQGGFLGAGPESFTTATALL